MSGSFRENRRAKLLLAPLALAFASATIAGCGRPARDLEASAPTPPTATTRINVATASPLAAETVPIGNPGKEHVVVVAAAIFPTKAKPGDVVTLAVRFRMAIGWHVSVVESADQSGPAEPTRLDLNLPAGVSPDGDWVLPQPDNCVDAMGRRRAYTDDVTFRRRLKIDARQLSGILAVPCTVSFQACNDTICTRPTPLEVRSTLNVIDR